MVTLQWSPPRADLQHGTIQFYTVQLMVVNTGVITEYTSMELSLTISDLHPHYTYTCTIAAVTVAPGPEDTVMFQMPENGRYADEVLILESSYLFVHLCLTNSACWYQYQFPQSVSPINFTTLLIYWQSPSPELQNGVIRKYRINVTKSETRLISYLLVGNMQTTVNNLHPYYSYTVLLYNSENWIIQY